MMTGLTLCSGGGLAALGLQAAGVRLVGAVEYDPAIAAVYAMNLGSHVLTAPVQEADYTPWAGVDVLQVSPPCPSFSVAKAGGQETELDQAIATAIVRALTTIRPRYFWLENVEGYAASASYRAIRAALLSLDYWSHATVVNSADMGVAQTRRRLILRAVAGGWMQPFRPLPAPVPWVGWYAAIADLLPTLPASQFADWQLMRLPAELTASFATAGDLADPASKANRRLATYAPHEPYPAVTASIMHRTPTAFLMGGSNTSSASLDSSWHSSPRFATEPTFTITQNSTTDRAWLSQGRVVKMTPRALARFQSVPDSYQLPERAALACKVLGNGVPVLVAEAVTASLLDRVAHERAA